MAAPPEASDVAAGVIELVADPERGKGHVFVVSGNGLEAVQAS
jgi:hypothetical protein